MQDKTCRAFRLSPTTRLKRVFLQRFFDLYQTDGTRQFSAHVLAGGCLNDLSPGTYILPWFRALWRIYIEHNVRLGIVVKTGVRLAFAKCFSHDGWLVEAR